MRAWCTRHAVRIQTVYPSYCPSALHKPPRSEMVSETNGYAILKTAVFVTAEKYFWIGCIFCRFFVPLLGKPLTKNILSKNIRERNIFVSAVPPWVIWNFVVNAYSKLRSAFQQFYNIHQKRWCPKFRRNVSDIRLFWHHFRRESFSHEGFKSIRSWTWSLLMFEEGWIVRSAVLLQGVWCRSVIFGQTFPSGRGGGGHHLAGNRR